MAHMGTEATHMAYSACEAVVMAHMGKSIENNGEVIEMAKVEVQVIPRLRLLIRH